MLEKVKAPANTAMKRTELALCKCSLVPLLSCLWSWFSSDWVSMVVFLLPSKNVFFFFFFFQQILSSFLPLTLSFLVLFPSCTALPSVSPSLTCLAVMFHRLIVSCLVKATVHSKSQLLFVEICQVSTFLSLLHAFLDQNFYIFSLNKSTVS